MRVAVADDSAFFRKGLVNQLVEIGIDVIAEADNGDDIIMRARDAALDAVILDIVMPPNDEGGLIAAEQLRYRYPKLGILILSAYAESDYAIRLLEPDPACTGYAIKHNVMEIGTLRDALERVTSEGSYVDRDVFHRLTSVDQNHPAHRAFERLTPQEVKILKMIAIGRANPFILNVLKISQKTLDSHLSNIYEKLQIPSDPNDVRRVLLILKYLHTMRH